MKYLGYWNELFRIVDQNSIVQYQTEYPPVGQFESGLRAFIVQRKSNGIKPDPDDGMFSCWNGHCYFRQIVSDENMSSVIVIGVDGRIQIIRRFIWILFRVIATGWSDEQFPVATEL